ncbi:hypothetical protein D3C86_1222180 [compost metagenome]
MLRLLVRICADTHYTHHHIGLVQHFRRLEPLAIDMDRFHQHIGREMRSEGIGQAKRCGEMRAVGTGAEQPERHVGIHARYGKDCLIRLRRTKITLEFDDIVREVFRAGIEIAAQGSRCAHISSRSAA